ncbi:leucine-rich repeat and IQ domain-containing protein 1 [Austrofundulus limnaeus]|uniref:Leucine-rich repeat and IQ domain-containing protein 1 n=1 Tax=Austrofundulus limnaeus TaxID=52670 RepID=A0A2I4C7U0_AUSLI|nr:PREDICTED: leucine-rich repeat and IQ domain-containing protein 1 [Austrofundulus limnaeus]
MSDENKVDRFSHDDEEVSEDIPPSLLSYFDTSKSRAAICEKLILEENDDSFNEDENDYVRESSNLEAERQKHFCEEAQKEEQRQQREMNFQEDLKKIMETEKRHQTELKLMERKAQEKIEQELLIQEELIANLKKQVEQERKMIEEEKKRNKAEEERMMKKEEKRKKDEEDRRKRQQERNRIEEEEKQKLAEMRVEVERERRKREDEQKKNQEDKMKKLQKEKKQREELNKKMEEERKFQPVLFREENLRRSGERQQKKKEEAQREGVKNKKREEETQKEEESVFLTTRKGKNNEEKIKFRDEMKTKEGTETKNKKFRREEEEMRKSSTLTHVTMKHEEMRKREEEIRKAWIESKGEGTSTIENKMELQQSEEEITTDEERQLSNKQIEKHGTETKKPNDDEEYRNTEDRNTSKQEINNRQQHRGKAKRIEVEGKREDEKENRKEMEMFNENDKRKEVTETDVDMRSSVVDTKRDKEQMKAGSESLIEGGGGEEEQDNKKETLTTKNELEEKKKENNNLKSLKTGHQDSCGPGPSSKTFKEQLISFEVSQQHLSDTCRTSASKTLEQQESQPAGLSEHTEQKRLNWMKDCVSWSDMSLQNRRKQKGSFRRQRGVRRAADAHSLPPLCPQTLLHTSGWKSLQEITTVRLEDVPGCSLSTLVQCNQLQSLTLRRCGLRSLEGVSQLQELRYIDVQENAISFVDCENMNNLRVLRLAHNNLTSIHGISGNLDVLELSYNSITRISGLECVKRLQKLLVDHNQLISTKGLRDVYTLLHLDCSHNHLAAVEGLESNLLLHTLDLRANSLTEPPVLNNQVLLRELRLDDNSISSLQGLSGCWLPLLQHVSVAQNRITQLPSMMDLVSLENLDLRFNCLSELHNVCENLKRCCFLREVHLSGNPLQQESGWRSALQKTVCGLKVIDNQQTDSCVAAQKLSTTLDSFLTFCRAQLQQTWDLQQSLRKELSNVSSPLDAMKTHFQHFTMALQLAENQRLAHEYGDTIVSDQHKVTDETMSEKIMNMSCRDDPKPESNDKLPPDTTGFNIKRRHQSFEDTPVGESCQTKFDSIIVGTRTEKTISKANSDWVPSLSSKEKTNSLQFGKEPLSIDLNLDLESRAAVVIQQRWRKCRQKCRNVVAPSVKKKRGEIGGSKENSESIPSFINRSIAIQDNAATVIQAFWRGFTLRRRLAFALAAVTCPDAEEDDTFEEVDVEEFVFDELAVEKHWTISEDSPPRRFVVSQQSSGAEPLVISHEPPPVWSPKQVWTAEQEDESRLQRISTLKFNSSQCSASASALSGLSERSEKILQEWGFTDSRTALLMLKRAQKMKSAKQRQKKPRNPSVHAALLRTSSYQLSPLKERNKPAWHSRHCFKVGETEAGLQQAERTEQICGKSGGAAQSDRHSNSERFLPEINSVILSGGRVQLVADSEHINRLHATQLCADSSLSSHACKGNSCLYRKALTHAREEASSPQRLTSALSKKERISFRDKPVQLSWGWGGGKKRDRSKSYSN